MTNEFVDELADYTLDEIEEVMDIMIWDSAAGHNPAATALHTAETAYAAGNTREGDRWLRGLRALKRAQGYTAPPWPHTDNDNDNETT